MKLPEDFPEGVFPETRVEQVSHICSLGLRPQLMAASLIDLLRGHFAEQDNLENPMYRRHEPPRDYVWRPDVADTGIVIDTFGHWNPKTSDFRPAVIVRRDDWMSERVGIGDVVQGYDAEGVEFFEAFLVGSSTIFCLSREAAAAEVLGTEVYLFFRQFSDRIRQTLNLLRFVPAKLGTPVPVQGEGSENWMVPISLAYAGSERWMTREEAPRLKKILISATLR